MQRTCNHPWMKFDLHGHNRATTPNNVTIEPGIVGTAINGTIRLQSDFEVRYSSLFLYSSFWYLLQLARDPRTACTWQSFARESSFFSFMIISSERMNFQSTTNWWLIHSLLPSSKWVSLVKPATRMLVVDDVLSKVYPSHVLTTPRTVDRLQFRHPSTPGSQWCYWVPSRPIPLRHRPIGKLTIIFSSLQPLTNDLIVCWHEVH